MTDHLFFGEDLGAGSNKLYGSHGGIQLQAIVAADTGANYLASGTVSHP